jgi:hypothetical protein
MNQSAAAGGGSRQTAIVYKKIQNMQLFLRLAFLFIK